ncbi:GNAT family N-acetyltransferase [Halegenticoccus soli]|uniref:GNAT family N-acetyltransferase n=1 Tax=Halegenticoccus soli TaxID=1985678 RepID=UPI000C6D9242|nr:GNAT family N-acetyltransferase [Halegenticoccus soli]
MGDGPTADDSPNATVREADPDDLLDVMRVLDAAMLEADADAVRERIAAGEALVAEADGAVVGALALDGSRVEAVAVRRTRRGRGIGSALVEAAAVRTGDLTAEFDPRVRPFYESLGFDVEPRSRRLRGRLRRER